MDSCFLCLQPVHSIRNVIFLVVLAFLRKIGFVWPPYPLCFLSYLLLPCAYNEALPVLYWVTLCRVCFLHSLLLQYVLRDLGTLTPLDFWRGGFSPPLSLLMSAFALLIPPAFLTEYLQRLTERSPTIAINCDP